MSLPKNISEPYTGVFQVRIKRNGKQFSKTFGGANQERKSALKKAIAWRDSTLKQVGGIYRVGECYFINKTTGINGIHSSVKKRQNGRVYLYFFVHYVDEKGKPKNKSFYAGNIQHLTIEKEKVVLGKAKKFRREYEQARLLKNESMLTG